MPKEIKLIRGGDALVPEDSPATSNRQTKVQPGEAVFFTHSPELKFDPIKFDNASPLSDGAMTADYGTQLFISEKAPLGSYPYSCSAKDRDGKPLHSKGGGEMIVIPGN